MGGFKLVTFPCLEKLSHTQHSILPRALSPGTSVALSELEEYHRERMVHLKHIKNLPKSFLYSENRRFPDGKWALFPAVCVCNLASQKHLGSAQLTDSCPLEFFLEKISEPTEWEKALGSNILKKYFKDWATVGSCSEPETGQISAVNMALWAKEDVLHTSHHQSLSSAFPALLCLPKGTIWSV